jgi:hypothetical protein
MKRLVTTLAATMVAVSVLQGAAVAAGSWNANRGGTGNGRTMHVNVPSSVAMTCTPGPANDNTLKGKVVYQMTWSTPATGGAPASGYQVSANGASYVSATSPWSSGYVDPTASYPVSVRTASGTWTSSAVTKTGSATLGTNGKATCGAVT